MNITSQHTVSTLALENEGQDSLANRKGELTRVMWVSSSSAQSEPSLAVLQQLLRQQPKKRSSPATQRYSRRPTHICATYTSPVTPPVLEKDSEIHPEASRGLYAEEVF